MLLYYDRFPALRLFDSVFISVRNALFTALAVGYAAATSASRRTRLVTSTDREEYLPLTPSEKSYSARISSRAINGLALLTFFIRFPFPTAGGPSADDTGDLAAFDVSDDHETLLAGTSDQ